MGPDRIVIGSDSKTSLERPKALYEPVRLLLNPGDQDGQAAGDFEQVAGACKLLRPSVAGRIPGRNDVQDVP